jgi:phage repressor protein C with HTH and peptisase S24 domain
MVPAFRPNDIAIVNPTLQPEPDTDVVLLDTDHRLAEAESIIKHLVNFNDRNWRLQQFKPEKVWNEPKVDWPICHRVVGKYDRRR